MLDATYLLIGGGLSSSQAAKLIRMRDAEGTILLVSKEKHLPYDRPPLSKEFVRGEKSRDDITYDTADSLSEKSITTRLGDAVHALDPGAKTATLASGERVRFEKALVATGGEPIRLDVPGADLAGVHYLRTLDDSMAIADAARGGSRAVVIGAGFIGVELAASLTQLGVDVTVVEAESRVWPRFVDEQVARYIQDYCAAKGVQFVMGDKVSAFEGDERVASVVTEGGATLECDFACVGIGIRPETALAERAGLEVADGIVVDAHMRTSHDDVYAAGDVANFPDPVFGRRRRVEHWGHAEYSGQVAGLNMAGTPQTYDLLTYVWSDVFDLHIEAAGDESDYDHTVVRGAVGDTAFTTLYLRQDRLVAYLAVNASSREFPKLQRLIRKQVALGGKDALLADPGFQLGEL